VLGTSPGETLEAMYNSRELAERERDLGKSRAQVSRGRILELQ
jgi:hypothetical protein